MTGIMVSMSMLSVRILSLSYKSLLVSRLFRGLDLIYPDLSVLEEHFPFGLQSFQSRRYRAWGS